MDASREYIIVIVIAKLSTFEENHPSWILEDLFKYTVWALEQVLNGSLISQPQDLLISVVPRMNMSHELISHSLVQLDVFIVTSRDISRYFC